MSPDPIAPGGDRQWRSAVSAGGYTGFFAVRARDEADLAFLLRLTVPVQVLA